MGSGYRTFTAGEVLTASNVQNYLQDQSVMVFGGSAARSSAIGTANFEEGMASYLTDTDKLEIYNGTNWVDVAPVSASGLTLISTTSFSGVTAQAITSVFSSTYRHYQIVGSITSSVLSTAVKLRLRSGSTDNTSTVYASGGFFTGGDGTTGNTDSSNGDTAFQIVPLDASSSFPGGVFNYTLFNPFETTYTRLTGFYERTSGAGAFGYFRGGNLEVTTSYDGINIITDTATNITGVVSIYGFNQ